MANPVHGEIRNYRIESTFTRTSEVTGHGETVSAEEKFCVKCGWVPVRGVMGALKWLAQHEDHHAATT